MTDKENLVGMLERAGIERHDPDDSTTENYGVRAWVDRGPDDGEDRSGSVKERAASVVRILDGGWNGFYTEFRFREDGSLIGVDCWE